jgi:ribonucleoside-diphosphate reductase alpha chain
MQASTASNLVTSKTKKALKLTYTRNFSKEGEDPYASVEWNERTAEIKDGVSEETIFRQERVKAPVSWSDRAVNIVAQKYFRGHLGTPSRESSVKDLIERVVGTIERWAEEQEYFADYDSIANWADDLRWLLVNQVGSFNSPVWFNIGVEGIPQQSSACFIQSVEDNMESIAQLQVNETNIFKQGSGTGTNFSKLRSSKEPVRGGGMASGPVSFMKGYDSWAGQVKSGGRTRRAAKMNILNVDHPDIEEYVNTKLVAENVAGALIDAGFDTHFDNAYGAYGLSPFQNANNSVRVSDAFMEKVSRYIKNNEDSLWGLKAVTTGKVVSQIKVSELWNKICEAAWKCGDPGLQFDTTINDWHTCSSTGRIHASNPCQPGFAPVLTPEGIRTFDDIDVGSTIWSGSCWTKVKRKVATGVKDVYNYYTRAGMFIGTENHHVISRGERVEVGLADSVDIAVGPLASSTEPVETQDVVDGLMFGDGYPVRANNGRNVYPVLCVGDDDQCYFNSEVADWVESASFDHKTHRVEATSLQPTEMPKTYLREVPKRFLEGSALKVRGFLRGLYSANGSVCGGRVTLKASSFPVIDAVQLMLSSLGIRSYYTVNKAHNVEFDNGTYTCRESYDLNITTDRKKFRELIGFIHPHKNVKVDEACSTKARNWTKETYDIVEKEFVGKLPVWDIEVEDAEHVYWTGGLKVSNCSEFIFLDDTSCNLASLNLLKFNRGKFFDFVSFENAVKVFIIAQEALVSKSYYPTKKIEENSHKYRPLGLGYSNLGALLVLNGFGYGSVEGRKLATEITSSMTAKAYVTSSEIARAVGPFPGFEKNRSPMLRVIDKHRHEAKTLALKSDILWEQALALGHKYGYRNAQVTVLAPTGTISFMMDCETTGCEPEFSWYKTKNLAGGGVLSMESSLLGQALENLGYDPRTVIPKIAEKGSAVGIVKKKHEPVFQTAHGEGALGVDDHINMLGALQPFLSGAISKTVNLPATATTEDISNAYFLAWEQGVKAVALYRDNSKQHQPLESKKKAKESNGHNKQQVAVSGRRPLPDPRQSVTKKFSIGGAEGYFTVGLYEDRTPGEIFIVAAKDGSLLRGLLDSFAISMSLALQYGCPLEDLVNKLEDRTFSPNGWYEGHFAKSIVDYLAKWLRSTFLETVVSVPGKPVAYEVTLCNLCGGTMVRSGTCSTCSDCGASSGGCS